MVDGSRESERNSRQALGTLMVIVAATFWGLSGTAAQWLFQHEGFSPGWLVTVRMLGAGFGLLLIRSVTGPVVDIFRVFTKPAYVVRLVVFSVIGLLGVQYTYFASIRFGNAATATFLQYLGPVLISVYLSIRYRRLPTASELMAIVCAVVGTFLLVTDGSLHVLTVPVPAVIWGLLSALALAFYTLYPRLLLQLFGSATLIGWAMLLGGLVMATLSPPWPQPEQHWSFSSSWLVLFVVIFGTLVPFYLYLASLGYINAAHASLFACAEPLSAAIAAVALLGLHLGIAMTIGGVCILSTIVLLSLGARPKRRTQESTA